MSSRAVGTIKKDIHIMNDNLFHRDTPSKTIGAWAGLVIFIIILISIFLFYALDNKQNYLKDYESLSTSRAKLEAALNSRMLLAKGLASYVRTNPDFNQEELDLFCASLVQDDELIRNLGVFKDTTIVYVYPYEMNKSALGTDLALNSNQKDDLLTVKKTQKPLITGMINLVQGGKGIVYRLPIVVDGIKNGRKVQTYWGQASIVIKGNGLLKEAEIDKLSDRMDIAIVSYSNLGNGKNIVYGSEEIYDKSTIKMGITLPYCKWSLAAVCKQEKPFENPIIVFLLIIGLIFSFSVSYLIEKLISLKNQLKRLAYHDALTKIPNRLSINDYFYEYTNKVKYKNFLLVILIFDIDKFKQINDYYGHTVGDLVLIRFAKRINSILRPTDALVRTGGDEFLLFLPDVRTMEDIEKFIARTKEMEKTPYCFDDLEVYVTSSVGYAVYPFDGEDITSLIRVADKSMYKNKNTCDNVISDTNNGGSK
jgi:diguanylate cyclase (GGDEF) domain